MKIKRQNKEPNNIIQLFIENGMKMLKVGKGKLDNEKVNLLKIEISNGNLEAYLYLVEWYLEQAEFNRDNSETALVDEFYEKVDKDEAILQAKKLIEHGLNGKANTAESKLVNALERQNSFFSILHLAYCYECGYGVAMDRPKAFNMYMNLASKEYLEAMCEVARCYAYGIGTDIDTNQMLAWYKIAANKGYSKAQYELGKLYSSSDIILINIPLSCEWYELAAHNGHVKAQFDLANILLEGKDIFENREDAKYWLLQSLLKGNDEAFSLYIREWGEDGLESLSNDLLEKLYHFYGDKLSRFVFQNLYDYYFDKGIESQTLIEKKEYFFKAKELKCGTIDEDIWLFYSYDLENAVTYSEFIEIYEFIIMWYGFKKSSFLKIRTILSLVAQEVIAFELFSKDSNLMDEVFGDQYIRFSTLGTDILYNINCTQRLTNPDNMCEFWLKRSLNLGNIAAKELLLNLYFKKLKVMDDIIEVDKLYNIIVAIDSKCIVENDDIKEIFAKKYLSAARNNKNIESKICYYKLSISLGNNVAKSELIGLYYNLAEKENDVDKIESLYYKALTYDSINNCNRILESYTKLDFDEKLKEKILRLYKFVKENRLGSNHLYESLAKFLFNRLEEGMRNPIENEQIIKSFIYLILSIKEITAIEKIKYIDYLKYTNPELNKTFNTYSNYSQKNNVEELIELVDKGDIESAFILGNCYFHGWGCNENQEEAVKWYLHAANNGHGEAQLCLADCYLYGWGLDISAENAKKWYQKAIKSNNKEAFNLFLSH